MLPIEVSQNLSQMIFFLFMYIRLRGTRRHDFYIHIIHISVYILYSRSTLIKSKHFYHIEKCHFVLSRFGRSQNLVTKVPRKCVLGS